MSGLDIDKVHNLIPKTEANRTLNGRLDSLIEKFGVLNVIKSVEGYLINSELDAAIKQLIAEYTKKVVAKIATFAKDREKK